MSDMNANGDSPEILERSLSVEREKKEKQLQVILQLHLHSFIKDFDFRDIEIYVNSKGIIFNDKDLKKIQSVQKNELRTILMFTILLSEKKDLIAFLDILRCDYQWLHDQLNSSIESYHTNKDIIKYLNVLHELRSRIPKHVDNNVRRVELFAQTRLYLKELRPWHYLVIYGELGYGKKWLAMDVCSDYSVIQAMDYKIFWLDVHNCDSQERDLEKLQRLKIFLGETTTSRQIGDYEGISNKILELQQDLKTILKQEEFKDCLLVLADVQNIKTIETFTFPCKILVTTRNKKILEYLSRTQMQIVNIDRGLSRIESVELLERIMEKDCKTFPSSMNEVIDGSESHPFLLNIIAQSLKDRAKFEWDTWASNLHHFRIQNDKVNNIIQLSLAVLKPEELELFHTLSIFHHSVKIPLPVLAGYWDKTEKETELIIKKFDRYFLATKVLIHDTNTVAITIHILYYNYLQNCVRVDLPKLHQKLVESYYIEDALQNRTDINLSIANDHYFYFYIGYHLKEARTMNYLFPVLYLDLGFLGQKLRYTGLPNTIGDLKYFRNEIGEDNHDREDFIDALHEFLPNIEEMIFKSEDTCLIQYALMTPDLCNEASRQASAFPQNVWFSDSDHFHRRRQMVPLLEVPKLVKLMEPNTCLVALANNFILVADLSLNYSHKPTCFVDHRSEIKRIVLFADNFFISFDADRNIRVWSTLDERRQSVKRRESLRFVVNQIDYSTRMKVRQRSSVQLINGFIQAFCVEKDYENNTLLHTALSDGAIQVQKWNSCRHKFEVEPFQPLQTNVKNMKFMELLHQLYVILTKDARLKIFRISDGSECRCAFEFPPDLRNPIGLHYYFLNSTEDIGKQIVVLICVFPSQAFQIRFPINSDDNVIRGVTEIIYEVCDDEHITCSTMSDDNNYLIVGTKHGILVLDLRDRSEVLRNSISDFITCVDIFSLDDDIYKYIIIAASKNERQLNIFGLKLNGNDTLTWANSIGTFVNESNLNLRFEPTAWLVGKQLFDVNLAEKRTVVAIDSKNRIHHLVDRNWSILVPDNLTNRIEVIKTFGTDYYYGCKNGVIYDSQENEIDTEFNDPITYLEIFEKDFLVASTSRKSLVKRGDQIRKFVRPIFKSYLLDSGYLLIVEDRCSVRLCNAFGEFEDCECVPNYDDFAGADFKQNVLVIAARSTTPYNVYKYEIFNDISGKPDYKEERCCCEHNGNITAIELSADIEFCAVGYSTGMIEIRKLNTMQLIQQLQSHHSPVYDMKFSPWISASLPIILVSISEQICFWNVTHAINNPLELSNNSGRHSSRFTTRNKRRSTDSGVASNRNSGGYDVTDVPMAAPIFWSNKKGPKDKAELLSCIKFAGNRAEKLYANEKFTEFVTIDDAGEIYFFKVNVLPRDGCESVTYNNDCNGNMQI